MTFEHMLLLTALPAAGNIVGGLLAEPFTITKRFLSLALHAAAGIILALVAVSIVPEALKAHPSWVIVLCFIGGGAFFILLDHFTSVINELIGGDDCTASAWMLIAAVAVDLVSDGVMLGASAGVSPSLAMLLAIGQMVGDIPQGFTSIAAIKSKSTPRWIRILISFGFAIPLYAGAAIGYFGIRGGPALLRDGILSFTGGLLATLVVEEIMPQAHRDGDARLATIIFVTGFALYMWISAVMG